MSGDTWDSLITLASATGEAAVVITMLRKGLSKKLPIFLCYILWALISDIAALYFQTHGADKYFYFTFYRAMISVDAVLQFTVLVELAWSVLRPVRSQLPKGTLFALIAIIGVIGLIAWPIAAITVPSYIAGVGRTIFLLASIFAVLRIVFFLIMTGFSQILSISWRDRELQVVTGLGFYSIVSLLSMLFSAHQGSKVHIHWFSVAVSISYLGTLAYWVLSFAAKEYQRQEFSPQMQQFLVYMGGAARVGSIALRDIPPDHSRKRD